MQSAKIIDVTRSFVPVNPNAFPETLHGTSKEDYPEARIPVVPYMGVNFLPTSYGYMSYFGTRFPLDIDSLLPNKVGHLFIFQTLLFKNILIALCDTGIWYKDTTVDGAWAQAAVITPVAEDIYFEWTYTFISNILYVYRTNGDRYYKIETSLNDVGATLTEIAQADMKFITLADQLGMFRIGTRIAFWDGANAISWSSPDDFTQFTPDILTGANVMSFKSILGSISAIRAHGSDAIVYATKSVNILEVSALETFLVKARPILNNVGVAYMRQSVEAVPNTTHFCYSDSGIFKIDKGVADLIVPQVYDYFKEFTPTPIYLKLLEGRYLCFESTDINAIDGQAAFTRTTLPPVDLTFIGAPGALDDVNALDPVTAPLCNITAGVTNGSFDEQKADGSLAVPSNLRKPGTSLTPIWTCYISNNGIKDLTNLERIETPCGAVGPKGTHFKMNPNLAGTLGKMTTDATNKTASTGASAWTDGKWTMERFVQVQTAIWNAEQKVAKAFIDAVLSWKGAETQQTLKINTCVVAASATANCDIGDYVSAYSNPQFGFNKCSFWLTRYALDKVALKNKVQTATTCTTPPPAPVANIGYKLRSSSGFIAATPLFGSVDEAKAYALSLYANPKPTLTTTYETGPQSLNFETVDGITYGKQFQAFFTTSGSSYTYACAAVWLADAHTSLSQDGGAMIPPALIGVNQTYDGGYTDKLQSFSTYNTGDDSGPGVWGVETAFCIISGWSYTDVNGNKQTAAAANCDTTTDKYPGATAVTRVVPQAPTRTNPLSDPDGNYCGLPYDSPIDPTQAWTPGTPDQVVEYAGYNFLLQRGSIAPRYPTFQGAFVYDLALKKWGKLKGEYKQLLDYSPLNSSSASTINFANFGIVAGLMKVDGLIYLFDNKPAESYLTWGKIGYYRLGVTDAQEVRVDFKTQCTGRLRVEPSNPEGTALGLNLATEKAYSVQQSVTCYPEFNGKWYNITLLDNFDVSFMEFRGFQKGRR